MNCNVVAVFIFTVMSMGILIILFVTEMRHNRRIEKQAAYRAGYQVGYSEGAAGKAPRDL